MGEWESLEECYVGGLVKASWQMHISTRDVEQLPSTRSIAVDLTTTVQDIAFKLSMLIVLW